MDPLLQTILVAGGIFIVSYLLGRSHGQGSQDKIIGATIDHLISDGYLYWTKDTSGDIILHKISELPRARRKKQVEN